MAEMNESLQEAVCIDDEIFFGPVTDKERKIREQFESKNKTDIESNQVLDNEVSRNDSLYKSFSAESKYDSFEDSLNIGIDEKPEGLKQVSLRKSYSKLKSKSHGFYDSLEDICSLVSNIDKCSISCDVESNFVEKHRVEDSLKNAAKIVFDNNSPSEQVHFDDDSLAIVELESTFDDSLEEFNIQSIEIEEINGKETVITSNLNMGCDVEQKSLCVTRNLFDASVEIIYEKKAVFDTLDEVSSSDDKNKLFDSLSNSDLKDILKDSLEESQNSNINTNVQDASVKKFIALEAVQNMPLEKETFDTSVQIIYEKDRNFSNMQNMCESNISNSDCADLSKDSLENFKKESKDATEVSQEVMAGETVNIPSSSGSCVLAYQNYGNEELFANKYSKNSQNILYNVEDSNFTVTVYNNPLSSQNGPNNNVETVILDSNHLELKNDNLKDGKDLKLQFQPEAKNSDENDKLTSKNVILLPSQDMDKKCTVDFDMNIVVDSENSKIYAVEGQSENSNIKVEGNILCDIKSSENMNEMVIENNEANITQRIKPKLQEKDAEIKFGTFDMVNTKLLQALDLHDVSILSESFIQSEDSLIPLNLCLKEQAVQTSFIIRSESKENLPQLRLTPLHDRKDFFHNTQKVKEKSPKNSKNLSKGTPSKRTPGTKIPVRKIDKLALPAAAQKSKHQVTNAACAEKVRKWPVSPYTSELGKKTPVITPNKVHYCKVRNTIFSKVPQITPSKKFLNIQSPVAQYIRSSPGCVIAKTPSIDPVLRDCMNDFHMRQHFETPGQAHYYQASRSAPLKSVKRKV